MSTKEILQELETLGTEQNRKTYAKHGADPDNTYGVSFANLYKIQKKIKIDHQLATELWNTKNTDARSLALLIADPKALTKKEANTWLKQISYYMIASLIGNLIAKTDYAKEIMEEWMQSEKEYIKQGGYDVFCSLMRNGAEFSDAQLRTYLQTIETEIDDAPNRARHAMNMALICIGGYKDSLTDEVIAAAKRIGKVEVDHGDTSCKTPDAIPYIQKMKARLSKKK